MQINEQSQAELRAVIRDVCEKVGLSLNDVSETLAIDRTRLENWYTSHRDALEDKELARLVDFGLEAVEAHALDVRQQTIDNMQQSGFNDQQRQNVDGFRKRMAPLRGRR